MFGSGHRFGGLTRTSPEPVPSKVALGSLFLKPSSIAKVLTDEEKGDIGLDIMMKEADRKKKVSKSDIMKALKTS